jgi:EpsI family protein
MQSFTRGGEPVGLFIGYYRDQDRRGELTHHENGLVPADEEQWRIGASHVLTPPTLGDRMQVRATHLRSAAGDLLVWEWYWVDGQVTTNPYLAKLHLLRTRIAGRGDDSAVLIAYTRSREPGDGSEHALEAFVSDLWPSVENSLRRAGGAHR